MVVRVPERPDGVTRGEFADRRAALLEERDRPAVGAGDAPAAARRRRPGAGRGWPGSRPTPTRRSAGCSPRRSVEPITWPSGDARRRRTGTTWRAASGRGRAASPPPPRSPPRRRCWPRRRSCGVRPKSPPTTSSTRSSRPRSCRSSTRADDRPVEERRAVLHRVEDVVVDRVVVPVADPPAQRAVERDRDQIDPGLDQPPGQQAPLAPGVPPVAVAHPSGLPGSGRTPAAPAGRSGRSAPGRGRRRTRPAWRASSACRLSRSSRSRRRTRPSRRATCSASFRPMLGTSNFGSFGSPWTANGSWAGPR